MKTKKILTAVILIITVIIGYQFSTAAKEKLNPVPSETITGEVIDLSCYLANGQDGRGPEHKECAIMCAKAGSALAILTQSGVIYFPVSPMGKNNNGKLLDFVGDNVKVTGTVVSQSGINGIKIESVKKLN
jgi:hypothetical protein